MSWADAGYFEGNVSYSEGGRGGILYSGRSRLYPQLAANSVFVLGLHQNRWWRGISSLPGQCSLLYRGCETYERVTPVWPAAKPYYGGSLDFLDAACLFSQSSGNVGANESVASLN